MCYHNIEILPIDDTYHFIGCLFCDNNQSNVEHLFEQGTCIMCNHNHSNHVLGTTWHGTPTSHFRKCTLCNKNIYCDIVALFTSITTTTHTLSCENGYSKTSAHTYNTENICTECGYHSTHVHNYTNHYVTYSDLYHKSYCSCGQYVLRPHIGSALDPLTPVYCLHCGFKMDNGIIITTTKKRNFEIYKEKRWY